MLSKNSQCLWKSSSLNSTSSTSVSTILSSLAASAFSLAFLMSVTSRFSTCEVEACNISWTEPGFPLRAVLPNACSSTRRFLGRNVSKQKSPPLSFTLLVNLMSVPRPARLVATMMSPESRSSSSKESLPSTSSFV